MLEQLEQSPPQMIPEFDLVPLIPKASAMEKGPNLKVFSL